MKKRVFIVATCIGIGLCILLIRLMQVQLASTESFTSRNINLLERSISQRAHIYAIHDGRGGLVDRHNEHLSEEYQPVLLLFPFLRKIDWPVEQVAKIVGVSSKTLTEHVERTKEVVIDDGIELTEEGMKQVNALRIPGVIAVSKKKDISGVAAEHLLGLVGKNSDLLERKYKERMQNGNISFNTLTGISGLQYSFDEFLLSDGEKKLLYHVDRKGDSLFGTKVKYVEPGNPFYPVMVKTTIHKQIQMIGEALLTKYNIQKGGMVLVDVKTNEVLALASKPTLDRNNYKETITNYMLTRQFPGSVFKTVIAAAALEKGRYTSTRTFNCDLDVYGEKGSRALGELSFEDSFAKSCNYTFATLGNELIKRDKNMMEEYAKKLGMEERVGWHGRVFHYDDFRPLEEEDTNVIWHEEKEKHIQKAVAQTAIGQKDVQYTPLAIANMMATIARGGERKEIKVVSDILYKNSMSFYHFEEHHLGGDGLQQSTVKILQQLMKKVTEKGGTAESLNKLPYKVAGKTGTAEIVKDGSNQSVNKWIAGYFPYENPRYALVVVELSSASTGNNPIRIFHDYVQELYKYDQQVRE
ncbi:peptidoglycan D,D-transpeptidase FtsI family protein [Priestia taiwanensis]|uniref:Penicillin-binding protein n=1 Tax=Priestia taiwanensis TaxID=1347902 RepID=A0A917EQX8_9BACI|nr:penicillin-binding protein 2 [Priestia taiwanensis]MBM7363693.1 cell division protein FtsI/penicillin-binding protein 2 [Priestia taiwanensis]GGE74876.1 penicillin-binding protein [Priestia taiwanensis]